MKTLYAAWHTPGSPVVSMAAGTAARLLKSASGAVLRDRGRLPLPLAPFPVAVERPEPPKNAKSLCCCVGTGLAGLGGTLKLACSVKKRVRESDAVAKSGWTFTSGRSHFESIL